MTTTQRQKFWIGPVPEKCDVCGADLTTKFMDCNTRFGLWGCLCPSCHALDGRGLGPSRGQEYMRQPDGKWLQTAGGGAR